MALGGLEAAGVITRVRSPGSALPAGGSDEDLVGRVGRGDPDALRALYERHREGLFGFLLRLAGDRMVAEEILQDTLVAVWRSAARFEGRSKARTWLFGVARRQAHNRLRPRASEPRWVGLSSVAGLAATEVGPEDRAIVGWQARRVAEAVARLSVSHREVLVLAMVGELSHAEIGEVLAVPVGTVKSRLHNARTALARLLDEQEEVR